MGTIQELKYKVKETMIERGEPYVRRQILTFTKQLNEEVTRLDVVLASLQDVLKRSAVVEEIKTMKIKIRKKEFQRRMEQEKRLEEMGF